MKPILFSLLVCCLFVSRTFAQGERVPIPAQPATAWVEHLPYFEDEPKIENLQVEFVPLKDEAAKQEHASGWRDQIRVAWEIKLVDAESGLPIERRFINTRSPMLCGTGYVPWHSYRKGSGSSIVLTGPDGVARFDGQLGDRENVDIYGRAGKCGDSAVDYQRASVTLPACKEGYLGRVTIKLQPLPSEEQQLWVLDSSNGRGLPDAKVSAALEWESFAVGQGMGLKAAPRVVLGSTDDTGSVKVPLVKDTGNWFMAEAAGYTPKWFWAYDAAWKDGYENWSGYLRKKGTTRGLDWPERLEVRLEREGSISGEILAGPLAGSKPLWVVVDWKAEQLFDMGEPFKTNNYIRKRKPRFEVRAAVGPSGMFRADGIPPGIPLRIRVLGQSVLHETVDPIDIKSGESRVWNWSVQDGVTLKLSLPERWIDAELYSAPNELPGWAPLPAKLFLYSGSIPIVKSNWTEAIPEHFRQGNDLEWKGLAAGRYVLRFVGHAPETDGYRTLVLDLEEDQVVTLPPDKPCTFLLPKGKYAGGLQLRAVHAETGEWFLGGKDLAGCQWVEGRLRMWMPDGEYYLALAYKGPDGCRKAFGRFPIRSGGCIDLSTVESNGGGRLHVIARDAAHSRASEDDAIERIPVGTVYQGDEPVMGVWLDFRTRYRASVVGLPVGDYEFRPISGEPQFFTLKIRERAVLQLPIPKD